MTDEQIIEAAIQGHANTRDAIRWAMKQVRGDAEPVASVHIKDGCLIGSQRKSGADFPDGQYGLYPIGTYPAPAVVAQLVEALEELARLGNGDRYGNSLGNEIAQKALKKWMECR